MTHVINNKVGLSLYEILPTREMLQVFWNIPKRNMLQVLRNGGSIQFYTNREKRVYKLLL